MMRNLLRKIFSPILNFFEQGDEPYSCKPLNRKILIVIGLLFSGLGIAVIFLSPDSAGYGYLFPAIVFLAAGVTSLVVGTLGSDRAVAKIWGSR